ncbi:hypothetical protein [Polyangium mundeleinium]|uniref:Lipoprotein n=1 Tax=Polyangium mundeleinium TaxID=2995306 RepID=A0ABT5F4J4_9BACT|nr:hypothetical protein [Polyangium mundeleinium]MDC0748993.1 hypothetical protein [Polyangium mundeleinium]
MRKSKVGTGLALVCLMGGAAVALGAGCSGVPETSRWDCDPDSLFPAAGCVQDAGIDDASDAGTDGPTADNGRCPADTHTCVPLPEGDDAIFWHADPPLLVWFGDNVEGEENQPKCPADTAPAVQARMYADLIAPPATCDSCSCKSATADCDPVPTSITIRAGTCDDPSAATISFDGPAGWDGSCTAANALPEGAECPPGSGVPCLQSIEIGPLPPPQNGKCEVDVVEVPKVAGLITKWQTTSLACRGENDTSLCDDAARMCLPKALFPDRICVWREGLHTQCPRNYQAEPARWMYPEQVKEGRGCTECACGAPSGGACVSSLRLFQDEACSAQFDESTTASLGGDCAPVFPNGRALGSKEAGPAMYMAGTCEASGGEPFGEAMVDLDNAVTFCCRPSYVFET